MYNNSNVFLFGIYLFIKQIIYNSLYSTREELPRDAKNYKLDFKMPECVNKLGNARGTTYKLVNYFKSILIS